jgi:hypothetical protein
VEEALFESPEVKIPCDQYDVARDGRFLINVDAGSGAPPITLLMNWKPGT